MPLASRSTWCVVLLALTLPLAFAAFTGHAWEDYYITLRASRNLVEGNGLVFNPGDRLHTFTSPLGVLLPALCTWIARPGHDELALWFFRVISVAFVAAGARMAWRRSESLGVGFVGRSIVLLLLLTDSKLLDFAINGMETGILFFFALLLWSELEHPAGPRPWPLAIAFGGLMWTRPDAFILAGALVVPHFIFRSRVVDAPKIPWSALIKGALIGGLLYVPWFAFAWWYYGTPVPHTIIAKSQLAPPVHVRDLLLLPWHTITGENLNARFLFMPPNVIMGGWPMPVFRFAYLLSSVALFLWVARWLPVAARRLSLSVFIGMFYFCSIVQYAWYLPPWTALATIALGLSIDRVLTWAQSATRSLVLTLSRVGVLLLLAVQALILVATAWEMRQQQTLIENNHRKQIGLWLRANASPGDTVFLEPLGYIGYFSQLKTYDYPGLSSREVVAIIHSGETAITQVITRLRPTWLVLRPGEIGNPQFPRYAVLNEYDLVKTYDATPQIEAVKFLPGSGWLEHDAEFRVFHRRDAAPLKTSAR